MDENIFYHHDARYNGGMVAQNLVLLQDHYTIDACADCILKHSQLIRGYAEEGLTLDNANLIRPELEETIEIIDKHLKLVLSCADESGHCRIRSQKDVDTMIQEVRNLRRKINIKVYGLEGDVTHDILAKNGIEGHAHHHGHRHAQVAMQDYMEGREEHEEPDYERYKLTHPHEISVDVPDHAHEPAGG